MGAPNPQILLQVIASGADPDNVTTPMPVAQPIIVNAASISLGYPTITLTPEESGGDPPFGQDANGFLNLLSGHTVWVEAGQGYVFNSDLATALGGYALGAQVAMADGAGTWINLSEGNTNDPDATGLEWAPGVTVGTATLEVTGGVFDLAPDEWKFPIIIVTGALTSNSIIRFPQRKQQWLVVNQTTGGFTLTATLAIAGSTGVQIPQGGLSAPTGVYGVATDINLYPSIAPLSVPIDQAATPLTLVERTNTGDIFARYVNLGGAPLTGAIVTVPIDRGDGFLVPRSLANFQASMTLDGFAGAVTAGQVPAGAVTQYAADILANAALTGSSTAVTPAGGTSNTRIATTAFVNPGTTIGANQVIRKNPDGTISQYFTVNYSGSGGTLNVAFPQAFPTTCIWAVGKSSIGGYQPGTRAAGMGAAGFVLDMTNLTGTAQLLWIEAIGN